MPNYALDQARLNQNARAMDLHEAMFGEKSQMDLERLSLGQQALMLQQAKATEAALLARSRLNLQIKRSTSAAAAIEHLGGLDPADPKFLEKMTEITSKYPDALGSTAFQKVFEDRRADHKLYQDAATARSTATFNDPDVAASYATSLSTTNDPKFANATAAATKELKDKAKSLAVSTDLTPEERLSVYDSASGKFNLDPAALTKLEVQANAVKAQRAATEAAGKPVKGIVDALKSLEGIEIDESKDPAGAAAIKAAKFNLQSQLKDSTFKAAGLNAPATVAGPSPDKVLAAIHSLGIAPGETPPAPDVPAPTPEEVAANAAAPTPAPAPISDNADPDDLLNEPDPVEE